MVFSFPKYVIKFTNMKKKEMKNTGSSLSRLYLFGKEDDCNRTSENSILELPQNIGASYEFSRSCCVLNFVN